MKLNLKKLENVHSRGDKTTTRCPACAEKGGDNSKNHLFINNDGRFGCILYPGTDGKTHRKRIFELAGEKGDRAFEVRKPSFAESPPKVILKDVLGRLGRINLTSTEKNLKNNNIKKDLEKPVPTVPEGEIKQPETFPLTSDEETLLMEIEEKDLNFIKTVKNVLNVSVISVTDSKTRLTEIKQNKGKYKNKPMKLYKEYFEVAQFLINSQEYDEGIKILTEAITLLPKMRETYYLRADAYLLKGDYNNAIEDCNKVLMLSPHHSKTYCVREKAQKMKEEKEMC